MMINNLASSFHIDLGYIEAGPDNEESRQADMMIVMHPITCDEDRNGAKIAAPLAATRRTPKFSLNDDEHFKEYSCQQQQQRQQQPQHQQQDESEHDEDDDDDIAGSTMFLNPVDNDESSSVTSLAATSKPRYSASVTLAANGGGCSAEQRAAHACGWLSSLYEPQENVSMPRSALYEHYLEACSLTSADPVNSATFGKLLRSVFPALSTRRLGTRGNSKYHYYGIGIKRELVAQVPMQYAGQMRTTPPGSSKMINVFGESRSSSGCNGKRGKRPKNNTLKSPLLGRKVDNAATATTANGSNSNNNNNNNSHNHNTGNGGGRDLSEKDRLDEYKRNIFKDMADFCRFLEQLCAPNPATIPMDIGYEQMQAFCGAYHKLLIEKTQLMASLSFKQVEDVERVFWEGLQPEDYCGMMACVQSEEAGRIMSTADDYFYTYIIASLFPLGCDSTVPTAALQSIRHFAKTYEHSLAAALPSSASTALPLHVLEGKLCAARRFALCLRRRTSSAHLAQAVRAVLGQTDMVRQMQRDWALLDLSAIREQVGWLFRMSDTLCTQLTGNVTELLRSQAPLRDWLQWADGCISNCLLGSQCASLQEAGRSLVHRWSLFSSLLLRDLTLKGGQSFGSFHLLRLLLDEYVMAQVEHRIMEEGRMCRAGWSDYAMAGGGAMAQESGEGAAIPAGLKHDVLMTPSKQSRWNRAVSEESLL